MRRLITALTAVLFTTLTPAFLSANPELVRLFAGCTGRFSAEMEHAWLMQDDTAQEHHDYRLTFVSLLDAVVEANHRSVLEYRIQSKQAQMRLLTTASFHKDQERAKTARAIASSALQTCKNLLLDN